MSYIKHLKSNLKRGFDGELAPLTLVVGKNASGKTSIAASLELALTGRIEGVGALGSELLSLASSSPLRVAAALSDGGEAQVDVSGTTAKASKVKRSGAEGLMLGTFVRDILTAEPKRQRAALLRVCTTDLDVAKLAADALPAAFLSQWQHLWSAAAGESDADRLLAVLESVRARLREFKSLVAPPGVAVEPPSEEEIAAACKALYAAEQRDRLPALKDEAARLGSQLRTAMQGAPIGDIRAAVSALRGLVSGLEYAAAKKLACCFACEAGADSARLLESARARLARGETALAKLHDDVAPGLGERCAFLQYEIERIEKLGSMFSLEHAQRVYQEVTERMRESQRVAGERKAYLAAQAELDSLKALENAANRMVETALVDRISSFESRAAVLAPVAVQLFDGAKSVCRVGLRRDSQIVPWRALSGAERTSLVAGVAAAVGAFEPKSEKLRVCIVDDVWLDSESLLGLCRGLEKAHEFDCFDQAIVCAVEAPEVSGWHRIEVSA